VFLQLYRRPDERQSFRRAAAREMPHPFLKTILRLLQEHAILLVCGLDRDS